MIFKNCRKINLSTSQETIIPWQSTRHEFDEIGIISWIFSLVNMTPTTRGRWISDKHISFYTIKDKKLRQRISRFCSKGLIGSNKPTLSTLTNNGVDFQWPESTADVFLHSSLSFSIMVASVSSKEIKYMEYLPSDSQTNCVSV